MKNIRGKLCNYPLTKALIQLLKKGRSPSTNYDLDGVWRERESRGKLGVFSARPGSASGLEPLTDNAG